MTERPILFSGPMVRAILAGRKTQTRRVLKPLPPYGEESFIVGQYAPTGIDRMGNEFPLDDVYGASTTDGEWAVKCPFGAPGDRLWVRETFFTAGVPGDRVAYRENGNMFKVDVRWKPSGNMFEVDVRWKPSIFMPRWASRLTLEVTGVRVERLQAISESDAEAEGCEPEPFASSKTLYRELWDSLYAKRGFGWDTNPHVWVVSFRRIKP